VRGKVRFYELRLFKSERAHKNRISRRTPFFLRRSSGIYDNSFSWKGWKCWWTQYSVRVYGKRKIPDQITYNEHLKKYFFFFQNSKRKKLHVIHKYEQLIPASDLLEVGYRQRCGSAEAEAAEAALKSTASATLVAGIVFEGTSFSLFSWKMTLFYEGNLSLRLFSFGFLDDAQDDV